jgi:hypothetical protein
MATEVKNGYDKSADKGQELGGWQQKLRGVENLGIAVTNLGKFEQTEVKIAIGKGQPVAQDAVLEEVLGT